MPPDILKIPESELMLFDHKNVSNKNIKELIPDWKKYAKQKEKMKHDYTAGSFLELDLEVFGTYHKSISHSEVVNNFENALFCAKKLSDERRYVVYAEDERLYVVPVQIELVPESETETLSRISQAIGKSKKDKAKLNDFIQMLQDPEMKAFIKTLL